MPGPLCLDLYAWGFMSGTLHVALHLHIARSKPWSVVSHVLGHEGGGSACEVLRRRGLLQSLSAGVGDETRVGGGFMWWRLEVELTEAGLGQVPEVVACVYRAIQVRLVWGRGGGAVG